MKGNHRHHHHLEDIKMFLYIFKRLRGLFFLQFTLLMSAGYTIWRTGAVTYKYPDDNPDTFPFFCNKILPWATSCFNDVELLPATYVYFIFEELILLALCGYIFRKAWKEKDFVFAHGVFMGIQFIDVFDYLIAYQKTWAHLGPFTFTFFKEEIIIGPYPLSWNVMKAVIFSIVIINEALTLLEGKLYTDK